MEIPRGHPDAILLPTRARDAFDLERRAPGQPLAPYVDYHWYVGWRDVAHHEQQVVPQPRIHVAAEDGRLWVHGVSRKPFTRTLTGTGHALGTSFRPGGFRCLLRSSVGALAGTEDVGEMVTAMEGYLAATDPEPDPVADQAHLTRVFTAVVGMPPATYRREA